MEPFRTGSSEALQDSPLAYLPTEVLTDTLTFLPIKDIFRSVTCVCQEWRELLMEQPEWWLGLICESLGLDRTGEAGTLVVRACEENRDRSGSSTYFLLAHFLSQLFSPTRASVAITTLTGFNRDSEFVDLTAQESTYEHRYRGGLVRAVNVTLGQEWFNHLAYPGQVLNHPCESKKKEECVVTLGNAVVGADYAVTKIRIASSFLASDIDSVLEKIDAEGGDGLAYLRCKEKSGWEHVNRFTGVPLFGRTPWADVSPQRRRRVALGVLFMLVDGQDLIDAATKRKHKALIATGEFEEVVCYPLSMVLEWVLDHVALRTLVQLRRT